MRAHCCIIVAIVSVYTVAQGTDGRAYPWGSADNKSCYPQPIKSTTLPGARPVTEHSPAGDSPYGVADLVGNVWQWTDEFIDEVRLLHCAVLALYCATQLQCVCSMHLLLLRRTWHAGCLAAPAGMRMLTLTWTNTLTHERYLTAHEPRGDSGQLELSPRRAQSRLVLPTCRRAQQAECLFDDGRYL